MVRTAITAVTAVGSADEALEVLMRERPDVLVSALAMPDKGGYWLIGRVRALPPERTSKSRLRWKTWVRSWRFSR